MSINILLTTLLFLICSIKSASAFIFFGGSPDSPLGIILMVLSIISLIVMIYYCCFMCSGSGRGCHTGCCTPVYLVRNPHHQQQPTKVVYVNNCEHVPGSSYNYHNQQPHPSSTVYSAKGAQEKPNYFAPSKV